MYLKVLLTHLGFEIDFINWVMGCLQFFSFVFFINGVASPLFHVQRSLHQGFPLYPLFLLLIVEGLNRLLANVEPQGDF